MSASVDTRATAGCFLDFQVIGVQDMIKTYPVIDFLSFLFPVQSESQNLVRLNLPTFLYLTPKLIEPLIYQCMFG